MQQVFNIIILAALAIVTLTLFAGIYTLFRGGDFGRSWSNKLMRLRVVTQAVAIALLVALMWWRGQPG
ncbi:MAG: twin transmembrane helix small protein [Asticcacaulis sp.]